MGSGRHVAQRATCLEHGLVALRATSPCRACGPLGHMPSLEYGMGQAKLGPCLIGTTFMIPLRNCCYAAIRYEIMKVVPLFGTVGKGAGAPGQWPFDWKSAVPAADGAVK